jgi:hypothetical protein
METSSHQARLLDSSGRTISIGRAHCFGDDSLNFYPQDSASSEAILTAKLIVLPGQKQRLGISRIEPCQSQVPHEVHFHIRTA